MKRLLKTLGLFVLLALITYGCTTLGPEYQAPTAPVQPDWVEYEDPALDTTPPVAPNWWKRAFNDPILDELVEAALEQNLTLRSAGLRVLQAQQNLAIAIGNRYPQQQAVSGQAEINGGKGDSAYQLYDLGFNLSWEADVWGRFKRQIESAEASLDASVAIYDGVMVSLIAQVAQTYLLIRTNQQRLEVAKENLKLQQESVRVTTAKFESGLVSALDEDQAKTLLYNTRASVASLELSLQQLKNSLAILLGKPPQNMGGMLTTPQPIPTVAPEVAIGMPQDLLRWRPDIREAERQLASQSAQIGFAISELYPHFQIGGSIATNVSTAAGLNFSDLFSSNSLDFHSNYFPKILVTFKRLYMAIK